MEKLIELTPEWILEKLTVTHYADGRGNVTITADTVSDSRWIDLALDTLGVKYETNTVGYDPDPKKQYFEVQWEFKIEDIKIDCPNLYAKWKIMDAQAYRLWEVQRLIDSSKKKEFR
jgi:hypothetical protein